MFGKINIEVTTYRFDSEYKDGRHPSKIVFGNTLKDDVERRDFTINGLAYQCHTKELHDHVGGLRDLNDKFLRTIGEADLRFSEDGLRPIRGLRFAAKLNLKIDDQIYSSIEKNFGVIEKVSQERFYDEMKKTILNVDKPKFILSLIKTNLIKFYFRDYVDSIFHNQKIIEKLLANKIKTMSEYAALIFYAIRDVPNKDFFQQQKYSKQEGTLCLQLLNSGLLKMKDNCSKVELKKHLSQIKAETIFVHLRFALYISKVENRSVENIYNCIKILRERLPLYIKDLSINGNDLKALNITGKGIGDSLSYLLFKVHEDEQLNKKENLIKLLKTRSS